MFGLGARSANGALEMLDLPEPREPESGELVLDMLAAGIGPWDPLLHSGGWDVDLVPPAALGVEGVGRVSAVGPGEAHFEWVISCSFMRRLCLAEAVPGRRRSSFARRAQRTRQRT